MGSHGVFSKAKAAAHVIDLVRRPTSGLVIVRYGRVGGDDDLAADLAIGLFEEQIAHLAESGAAMNLDGAVVALGHGADLTGRVVLTFDEATAEFAEKAAPILVHYGVPASLFVATNYIENGLDFSVGGPAMTWSVLHGLAAFDAFTIEARAHTGRSLVNRSTNEIAHQIDAAIDLIVERTGQPPRHFAYSSSMAEGDDVEQAIRLRFDSAMSGGDRPNQSGADVFDLHRTALDPSDGMGWFLHKINGGITLADGDRHETTAVDPSDSSASTRHSR